MGALECQRNGCLQIMCDRRLRLRDGNLRTYSMYICHYCFEELEALKDEWPLDMSRGSLEDKIMWFMTHARPEQPVKREGVREWEDWWNDITRYRE